jgi:hypothetical protein
VRHRSSLFYAITQHSLLEHYTSKKLTCLQTAVPKSQANKSRVAVLQHVSEGLPILVLDEVMQAATPLLVL